MVKTMRVDRRMFLTALNIQICQLRQSWWSVFQSLLLLKMQIWFLQLEKGCRNGSTSFDRNIANSFSKMQCIARKLLYHWSRCGRSFPFGNNTRGRNEGASQRRGTGFAL